MIFHILIQGHTLQYLPSRVNKLATGWDKGIGMVHRLCVCVCWGRRRVDDDGENGNFNLIYSKG